MTAYYNEIEPYKAQWLRNLIAADLIAPGIVDDRSIRDVQPADLEGFVQCHFFAGIGIWSGAARGAGWPDDQQLWTASCPCQPFSNAGDGGGFNDERHLWPDFWRIACQCRPDTILGEQADSPAGRAWLDLVSTDMESAGYAVAPAVLCSAGFGAPNIRNRIYWMGHASQEGLSDTKPQDVSGARWQDQGRAITESSGPFYPWREPEWITRGARSRPFEPGSFPVVARHPSHVGQIRAYGDAINYVVAREFIAAAMECLP